MSDDLFLQLSGNPRAKKLIQSLGLPLPMPQPLARRSGPWEARPLADRSVLLVGALDGEVGRAIAGAVVRAGGDPISDAGLPALDELGEAWGRPRRPLADLSETERVDAIVFDATTIATPAALRGLYDAFHPHLRRLRPCGRVVVVGRPADEGDATAAAARQALDGFTRSLAKEVGRRGSTANLVVLQTGAEARLEAVLRFLLSERAVYVTCQPLHVTRLAANDAEPPSTRVLEGKTALVTGGARGIGAATAKQLADEGAHVVVLDRPADAKPASQVARAIGGSVLLQDITDPDAPAAIREHFAQGGVDVVVHNAGITRDRTLPKMKAENWDLAVDVNLGAVLRIDDALLADAPVLNEGGRIICLSSVAGLAGNVGQTNYAASKAGIAGYVARRALDVADRGVTVNAIAPGFIETRLTAAMPVMIREAARRLAALGQGGLPEDVGQAITFLASPGSVGLSGRVLRVCGGALVGA